MKKQFILLICVLSGYIGYAQQGIDVLDFIKNAPWDLTKSEIDAKYENYKFELADSVKTLIPNNFITLGDNIFSGFQLGKYNGFTCYIVMEIQVNLACLSYLLIQLKQLILTKKN